MQNFEKNQKVQKAIANLYTSLRSAEYGTIFSWEQLGKLMCADGLTKQQIYYVGLKVNSLLMAYDQRVAHTIHGLGKKILNPSEHDFEARQKVKQSQKKYICAGKILAATNMEMLNGEQQKEIRDAATKFRTLELFTSELLKKKSLTPKDASERNQLAFNVLKYLSNE